MKNRHFVISLPVFVVIIVIVVFASTLFGVLIASILTKSGNQEKPQAKTEETLTDNNNSSQKVSQEKPKSNTSPSLENKNDSQSSRELSKHFAKGIEYYNQSLYHQAAYEFQLADSYKPGNPETCYYLMLCWSKIEDNPTRKNSVTLSLAKRLVTIAPGSRIAEAAEELLKKSADGTSQTVTTGKTEQASNADIKKPEIKPSLAPAVKESHNYPKAMNLKKPQDMEIRKIDRDKESQDSKTKSADAAEKTTASIEGTVSRLDEKGQVFNPSGTNLVLLRITGGEKYYATTDGSGRFRFEGVKPDGNYALVCLSKYKYTRYVQDYYYNNYTPYPPCPPLYGRCDRYDYVKPDCRNSIPGIKANVIIKENNHGKIGIGPFSVKKADIRISSGYGYNRCSYAGGIIGGVSYYPGYAYGYNTVGIWDSGTFVNQRAVDVEYNISWHLRMDLKQPVEYSIILNQDNADVNYFNTVDPEYGINREPYKEIKDVVPNVASGK
ncbi:MAG: carboxypeptidase-like regulatory domain-containing protein [Firmicutes bacterium]|nr:carboxypeptidase-like regulatory domain-containing protein [Bacillota bacterium]